jgi:hypothetical protein
MAARSSAALSSTVWLYQTDAALVLQNTSCQCWSTQAARGRPTEGPEPCMHE